MADSKEKLSGVTEFYTVERSCERMLGRVKLRGALGMQMGVECL